MPGCSVWPSLLFFLSLPRYISDQVRSLCKQALNLLLIQMDLGRYTHTYKYIYIHISVHTTSSGSITRWCNAWEAKSDDGKPKSQLTLGQWEQEEERESERERVWKRNCSAGMYLRYYQGSVKRCRAVDSSSSSLSFVLRTHHDADYLHKL